MWPPPLPVFILMRSMSPSREEGDSALDRVRILTPKMSTKFKRCRVKFDRVWLNQNLDSDLESVPIIDGAGR